MIKVSTFGTFVYGPLGFMGRRFVVGKFPEDNAKSFFIRVSSLLSNIKAIINSHFHQQLLIDQLVLQMLAVSVLALYLCTSANYFFTFLASLMRLSWMIWPLFYTLSFYFSGDNKHLQSLWINFAQIIFNIGLYLLAPSH